MDCNICCEKINRSTHKPVKCPYCEFETCLVCFRRYLLDSATEPACMSCRHELSLEFVSEVTPKSFHNTEYRAHRAQILLEREKSLLPTTQNLLEALKDVDKEMEELKEELDYLRIRQREIKDRLFVLKNGDIDRPASKKRFIKGCSNGDCRGFLTTAWKCGTCDAYACKDCHGLKKGRDDPDHVCNEDDVATARFLAKDTKPCPKCAIPIHRISGCSQMWCPSCHTPFSWKTGQIETGRIHNPHFFEWQREQNNGVAPRVPGDVPYGECGGLPSFRMIEQRIRRNGIQFPGWTECYQVVEHTRQVVMPIYPAQIGIQDNEDLRIKYLQHKIDEAQWKRVLKMRAKKHEKNHAINQILEMFVTTMTDLWIKYANGKIEDTLEIAENADRLRLYTNRNLVMIKQRFGTKTPLVSPKWRI